MRKAMSEAVRSGTMCLGKTQRLRCLEEVAADLFNMESGLFVASGTQGNLLALCSAIVNVAMNTLPVKKRTIILRKAVVARYSPASSLSRYLTKSMGLYPLDRTSKT